MTPVAPLPNPIPAALADGAAASSRQPPVARREAPVERHVRAERHQADVLEHQCPGRAAPRCCSGTTTKPTSGTNAIRPTPDQASADARVAATSIASTTRKTPAELAVLARERTRVTALRGARHADVLGRDRDLQQQVQQVDRRDPDRPAAERGECRQRDDEPAVLIGQHRETPGTPPSDRRVNDHQREAEREVAPKQPRAALDEALERERDACRRCPAVIASCSIGPAISCASSSTRTVPPLTRNISTDPPTSTMEHGRHERDQRAGLRRERVRDRREDLSRACPAAARDWSAPTSMASERAAPTTGTDRSSLNVVCAAH